MAVEISDVNELQAMQSDLTEDYVVVNDIDASATSTWNSGAGFEPVGDDSAGGEFTGSFNGGGFTITGLFIDRSRGVGHGTGLFGRANGAPMSGVTLSGVDISEGSDAQGGVLVGLQLSANITDCHSSGSINCSPNGRTSGGIVGVIQSGTVSGCSSSATVTGAQYSGGIIGRMNSGSQINTSNASGGVTTNPDNAAGGLVGEMRAATNVVEDCHATGDVDSTGGGESGGLVGLISGGTLRRCYATGGATSTFDDCGGVFGRMDAGTVEDCYSQAGTVNVPTRGGGFGGLNNGGSVARCYATNPVSGSGGQIGGFLGWQNAGTAPVDCFWDTETSGQASDGDSSTATGKTTAEMQDVATYADTTTTGLTSPWDFENDPNDDAAGNDYWGIQSGFNSDYPYLTAIQSPPSGGGGISIPVVMHHRRMQGAA